jgi:hypothetical protein
MSLFSHTRRAGLCVVSSTMLVGAVIAESTQAPPEPSDYSLDNYRAPTPATLSGARVVSTPEAHRL